MVVAVVITKSAGGEGDRPGGGSYPAAPANSGNGGGGSPSNEKKTTQVTGLMSRSNSTATADQIQVAQVFNPNDRNPFDMETNVRSWFTQKG